MKLIAQKLSCWKPFLLSATAKRYSSSSSCTLDLVEPLNKDPIGYVRLPGYTKYDTALELQSYLVARRHRITQKSIVSQLPADIIVFLEHPPTYTAGRRIRGKTEDTEEQRLKSLGADYHETMRGGQVTYHGPGQLIAYPILDIRDYQLSVKCYVSRLEKTVIDCCSAYGISANTTENTGVWVGQDRKIAALGVHLQRYVSSHGLALNCNTDLKWFKEIVACGLQDKDTTSISRELNQNVTTEQVLPRLVSSFESLFLKQLVAIVEIDKLVLEQDLLKKLN